MNGPSSTSSAPSTDCPPAGRVDAYFDQELSVAERAAIDSHLATCAGCRTQLEQVAAASAIMKSIELPALSQMSQARLTRDLTDPAGVGEGWILPVRLLTAAAAVIFLLAASLIAYQLHHSGPGSPANANVQPIIHSNLPGSSQVIPAGAAHPAQP